jgi:isopentenyl diphosphate isomerase/L-lactate dehydrogenase-like FMN-dependent dehydrogenase
VLSPEDALLAVKCGVDGIIVSNHGEGTVHSAVSHKHTCVRASTTVTLKAAPDGSSGWQRLCAVQCAASL